MTDRPLRIAHVTATFPPYYGGTGTVCYHNARVLAARGHDVHVYTASWPGEPDDPPGVTVHRLHPVVRIGNAPVLPQLARMPRDAIVHLHFPFYTGAEFMAMARRPYVVTYHQDVELVGWMGRLTKAHDRTIGRRILRRADRLCPTSLDYFQSSAFADLIPAMGDRIVPIPNGVDSTTFCPRPADPAIRQRYGVPQDAPLALFVGSMDRAHYFKGIPTLLRALARLSDVEALLVGEGDLRPEYERLVGDLGLARRVRFTGRVPVDELPDLYRAADLFVLPSETRGEAFGVVLLEAMASGRPVIATDLPGVRSVVASGVDGVLVPPSDADALAAAIAKTTLLTPEARATMGMAGRRKVEAEYDWERIGDRLEALYQGIREEKSKPMAASGSQSGARPALPIELRAALDVIVRECGGTDGLIRGRLIGSPRLIDEVRGYASVDTSIGRVIALAPRPEQITSDLTASPADEVVTLVAGPLHRIFEPLRKGRGRTSLPGDDLPSEQWAAMGYECASTLGLQGVGSISWAIGERLCRRIDRPDLADRCRIGMLRTLVVARPFAFATVRVRRYRRVTT